jgi:hypothetical protein
MPPELIPDPESLKLLGWFVAIVFLRDLSLSTLARLAKKVRSTPDKSDDWLADVADVLIATLKKVPMPGFGKKTPPT